MKKKTFAAVGIVAALALTSCSGGGSTAEDGSSTELNVYAWDGEFPETIIDGFTEETGIEVTIDNFDSNETMIAKLAAGASGYDIVNPSQYAVQQLIGQGLLEELDHDQIEGLDNISTTFVDPTYDPGNKYSLPWVWGTTGILYNSTCTAGEEITSWESMWDPKYDGKLSMLDNMLAAYIAGLQINGYGADSTDEAEIEAATQSLIEQKPLLAAYNATNYVDLVVNGDVCIAEAWGGSDTALAVEDNDDVHYIVPEEGGSLWVDGLAIAKDAPHEDAAYKFLNYLLEPEVAAILTNEGGMATANAAALDHVTDESLLTNAAVFATEEEVAEADFIVDPGAAMKFYQDGWTRVRAS